MCRIATPEKTRDDLPPRARGESSGIFLGRRFIGISSKIPLLPRFFGGKCYHATDPRVVISSRRIGRRRCLGGRLAVFEEVLREETAEFGDFGRGFSQGIERDREQHLLAFDL